MFVQSTSCVCRGEDHPLTGAKCHRIKMECAMLCMQLSNALIFNNFTIKAHAHRSHVNSFGYFYVRSLHGFITLLCCAAAASCNDNVVYFYDLTLLLHLTVDFSRPSIGQIAHSAWIQMNGKMRNLWSNEFHLVRSSSI